MQIRSALTLVCFATAISGQPTVVCAESPLSAIDWLTQSVTNPAKAAMPAKPAKPSEPAVTVGGALPKEVAVSVLGGPSPDAVGLLSPAQTGFPAALWGLARTDEIIAALTGANAEGLPALQSLLVTLVLAEAIPPADAGASGRLLIARIDKLLQIGALDQAQALLDAAEPAKTADLFRRSFDAALLTGNEDRACTTLAAAPELSPTLPTRVFCLARAGDWGTAALTLRTAEALGRITPTEGALLARFLDPDLFEADPVPAPPKPVTPLIWRIYEAIGEPLPTATMPLAFAHAELSERAGWKSQVEAVERLARVGAVTPNLLLGLYTERDPAASGGVWDRVDAFQRFDAALQAGDVSAVEQRLPLAFARMMDVELEVPFATLFAEDLAKLGLKGDAARIAYDLGLLSPAYARLAKSPLGAADVRAAFLAGLAAGVVADLPPPDSMARAIAPAFGAKPDLLLSDDARLLVSQKRLGEAMLLAIARIAAGLHGEIGKVTEGLAILRVVGLEDIARRTALELMLLERRG
jgi:hypothetical protein